MKRNELLWQIALGGDDSDVVPPRAIDGRGGRRESAKVNLIGAQGQRSQSIHNGLDFYAGLRLAEIF